MKVNIKKFGNVLKSDTVKIMTLKYGLSLLVTVFLGSILIFAQGESPTYAMAEVVEGAFGSLYKFGNTLRWTAPCLILGIAASVSFKAGVQNLGLSGQCTFGGLVAAVIGYSANLPPLAHILLCIFAAGFTGMLYVLIPAVMRLFFGINEFIATLMLNFVAEILSEYTVDMILTSSGVYTTATSTPSINDSAVLPIMIENTSVSYSLLIAIVVALALYAVYKFTVPGYELKQTGENLRFAKVGGVKVVRNFLLIFLLSGFIAGACGGIEVLGVHKKFNVGFATNLGWDGIMVARIAESNPIACIFVAFIWGALKAGSLQIERVTELNRFTVECMKMFFVLMVSIDYERLFYSIKYAMIRRNRRNAMEEA